MTVLLMLVVAACVTFVGLVSLEFGSEPEDHSQPQETPIGGNAVDKYEKHNELANRFRSDEAVAARAKHFEEKYGEVGWVPGVAPCDYQTELRGGFLEPNCSYWEYAASVRLTDEEEILLNRTLGVTIALDILPGDVQRLRPTMSEEEVHFFLKTRKDRIAGLLKQDLFETLYYVLEEYDEDRKDTHAKTENEDLPGEEAQLAS